LKRICERSCRMMKKYLLLILAMAMCVSLCSCEKLLKKAKAYVTGTEESEMPADFLESRSNEEFDYDVYKDHIVITGYKGESTSVTLPEKIDGREVRVIGSLAFYRNDTLQVIHIPSTVNEIRENGFYQCEKLETVRIPNTVTKIGTRAFGWCDSLTSVSLGSGVTAVPDYCFNHCVSLEKIVIPSGITSIGVRAFSYCENLKEISVPNAVASLGDFAFAGCPALEYVVFVNSGVKFGMNVFRDCESAVIIAPDGSTAKDYCATYGLRWSTSRSVEAVVPVDPNAVSADESADISEEGSLQD